MKMPHIFDQNKKKQKLLHFSGVSHVFCLRMFKVLPWWGLQREHMAQVTPKKITPTPSMHFLSQVFEVRVDNFWTGRRWSWIFGVFFSERTGAVTSIFRAWLAADVFLFKRIFASFNRSPLTTGTKVLGKLLRSLTASLPLHIYHLKRKGVSSNSHFSGAVKLQGCAPRATTSCIAI